MCGHVERSRFRVNKQILVSNGGLLGKLVKVPVQHLYHDGQHQLLRAELPAQQKSGAGDEMSFRPIRLRVLVSALILAFSHLFEPWFL
ncbi:hypothetical protein PF002_g20447 [Phytophthora fragariae]|uniref:Uncharacterized protein n=1 Tax=Phytophthora fragariae TaxID=53985 RepID=A0A6A3XT60_9STRA|nr:hypothetical protein PF002_g20447 [Phytophthora fragariae]